MKIAFWQTGYSLLDWMSVERLKKKSDVVSCMFLSVRGEQHNSIRQGNRQARKESIAVVEA